MADNKVFLISTNLMERLLRGIYILHDKLSNRLQVWAHDVCTHLGIKKCYVCAQDFVTFVRLLELSKM